MNPDSNFPQPSPRDLLEERVTALILGELSESDAAEIRGIMATDASLKAFHNQMTETIGLVSDTLTQPAETDGAESIPELKLSDERREALQTAFESEPDESTPTAHKPSPEAEAKIRRPWFSYRLVQVACALAIMGLLAAVILPNFVTVRKTAQVRSQSFEMAQKKAMTASPVETAGSISESENLAYRSSDLTIIDAKASDSPSKPQDSGVDAVRFSAAPNEFVTTLSSVAPTSAPSPPPRPAKISTTMARKSPSMSGVRPGRSSSPDWPSQNLQTRTKAAPGPAAAPAA